MGMGTGSSAGVREVERDGVAASAAADGEVLGRCSGSAPTAQRSSSRAAVTWLANASSPMRRAVRPIVSPWWRRASHVPTMASTAAPRSSSPTRPTTSPSRCGRGRRRGTPGSRRPSGPSTRTFEPASPMSAIWCWAHEFGQPEAKTRSVGLRRNEPDRQVPPGAGRVGDAERAHGRAGAGADLGVAALAEQEQAAFGERAADRRHAGQRDVAKRDVLIAGEREEAVGGRSARSQNSSSSWPTMSPSGTSIVTDADAGHPLRPDAGAPSAGRALGEDRGPRRRRPAARPRRPAGGRAGAPRRTPRTTRRGRRRRPCAGPGTSYGPWPARRSCRGRRTRRTGPRRRRGRRCGARTATSSTPSDGALPRLPPAHTS